MVVQAYIPIQTEVGKAATVAEAIAGIPGAVLAEDVTGPYDVIARVEASTVDELGKLVIAKIQDVRHHPHPDVHGRPRVTSSSTARRTARASATPAPSPGVAGTSRGAPAPSRPSPPCRAATQLRTAAASAGLETVSQRPAETTAGQPRCGSRGDRR